MDIAEIRGLRTPDGQHLLAELPPYHAATALGLGERLRAEGHAPALVAAVLTQSRLRTKVRPRWGPIVDLLTLTADGAEQGTRPAVADHRAQRYAGAGVHTVLDLGCGLGMDALAFARVGIRTIGVERDPVTAAAADANAAALGLTDLVDIVVADVTQLDLRRLSGINGVFADPARRRDGHRLRSPNDWSPALSWVLDVPSPALGIKVAPGLAHDVVPGDTEFEVVSVAGDVVEAGLYRGPLRTPSVRRRATLFPAGVTLTDGELPGGSPPTGAVGRYLFEPDGAVIRSGLVGAIVRQLDGRLLDPTIAYVTTDHLAHSDFATPYEVTDVMPFSLKRLRTTLRDQQVGRVTIKKRGSAVEPEALRKQLRLDRQQGGEATLFLTRIAGAQSVVFGRPVAP